MLRLLATTAVITIAIALVIMFMARSPLAIPESPNRCVALQAGAYSHQWCTLPGYGGCLITDMMGGTGFYVACLPER